MLTEIEAKELLQWQILTIDEAIKKLESQRIYYPSLTRDYVIANLQHYKVRYLSSFSYLATVPQDQLSDNNDKAAYLLDLIHGDMAMYPHATAQYLRFVRAQIEGHGLQECLDWCDKLKWSIKPDIKKLRENLLTTLNVLIEKREAVEKDSRKDTIGLVQLGVEHYFLSQAHRELYYWLGMVLAKMAENKHFVELLYRPNPFKFESEREAYFIYQGMAYCYNNYLESIDVAENPHRAPGQFPWIGGESWYHPSFDFEDKLKAVLRPAERAKFEQSLEPKVSSFSALAAKETRASAEQPAFLRKGL